MILLGIDGKFVVLSEAKISLHMHKADVKICYSFVTGDFPSSG